jgi:hypothetical protein
MSPVHRDDRDGEGGEHRDGGDLVGRGDGS